MNKAIEILREEAAEQLFNRLCPGSKWWKMDENLKDRYRTEIHKEPTVEPQEPLAWIYTHPEQPGNSPVLTLERANQIDARGWVEKALYASPSVQLAIDIDKIRDALTSAMNAHGKFLASNPPQDMWIVTGVDRKITEALTYIDNASETNQ